MEEHHLWVRPSLYAGPTQSWSFTRMVYEMVRGVLHPGSGRNNTQHSYFIRTIDIWSVYIDDFFMTYFSLLNRFGHLTETI